MGDMKLIILVRDVVVDQKIRGASPSCPRPRSGIIATSNIQPGGSLPQAPSGARGEILTLKVGRGMQPEWRLWNEDDGPHIPAGGRTSSVGQVAKRYQVSEADASEA
jgi:hypothetical protein